MKTSSELSELATALAKAQSEMKPAIKDSVNPFFKSKYADFASIWEAVRIPLTKNGLSVVQTVGEHMELGTVLSTRLLHSSGQWIEDTMHVHMKEATAQAQGSAITYAKRYALSAMVGVATEDDDGNAAVAQKQQGYAINGPHGIEYTKTPVNITNVHAPLKVDYGPIQDLRNETTGPQLFTDEPWPDSEQAPSQDLSQLTNHAPGASNEVKHRGGASFKPKKDGITEAQLGRLWKIAEAKGFYTPKNKDVPYHELRVNVQRVITAINGSCPDDLLSLHWKSYSDICKWMEDNSPSELDMLLK